MGRCVPGLVVAVGCSIVACSAKQPAPGTIAAVPLPGVVEPEVPIGPGARTPNVVVGGDGLAVLSWQQSADGGSVRFARRDRQGQWGPTRTLALGSEIFVNWADFPLVMSRKRGGLTGAWLQRSASGYGIQWRHSKDDAHGWSAPAALSAHEGGPEYGFVTLSPAPGDALDAFWLDGRAVTGHGEGAMQLRRATIGGDGVVRGRALVDDRVCDCCQTASAATPRGPVVAYRDRSATEVRDIVVAGPEPKQRRNVGNDHWTIDGCPVNGPAIAASDAGLVVAWFSGARDTSNVQVAFASLSGPFSATVAVDLGRPLGRVDVAWLDAQHAVVTFLERSGAASGRARFIARSVARDGRLGPPWVVGETSVTNGAGFPRIARAGDTIVWTWTADDATSDHDDATSVRVVETPVSALQ
ncbi:MAG: hypothetical protein AAF721_34485 [Myxococcota bacterium]